ncbi:MAG: HupE/UreJ family protein [Verrucomicrobiota bacterium]
MTRMFSDRLPEPLGAGCPSESGQREEGVFGSILRRFLRLFSLLLAGAGIGYAHDPGISTAQGELRNGVLFLTTGFAPGDIEVLLPPHLRRADRWAPSDFEAARETLERIAVDLWSFNVGERKINPLGTRVELLPGDNVSFEVSYALGAAPGIGRLSAIQLPRLPPGHRQFVVISDRRGSTLAKKLIGASDMTLEVALGKGDALQLGADAVVSPAVGPAGSDSTAFLGFIRLGLEHIWTGYDHLLFLLALLIVCQSVRSTLGIVTCFTLAHSITLSLATFNVVSIPSRLVEAAIAGSIVFVAAENLLRRGHESRGRWAVTFGFGLIHGFGFASVLRDLGVGGAGRTVLMPLFSFNFGVELGQIAVAALVLPILSRLRRSKWFVAKGVPAVSTAAFLAGFVWLLQRTMFP